MSKFCLVTSEIVGPFKNGGIGTHCYYLAQYLACKSDFEVTIIYNGEIDGDDSDYWTRKFQHDFGAAFVWIRPDFSTPQATCSCTPYWDRVSQANLEYLRSHHYDVVLFQEMLGGGFRAIQAKKGLGLFQHTMLAVMVHSSWQWVNESMQLFPAYGLSEMLTKFIERYSVMHCDALVSPSQYMLSWTAGDVESLPSFQRVLPYLFDPDLVPVGHDETVSELIFFGRLEQRKGLILFLDSLLMLHRETDESCMNPPVQVFFLGKPGRTADGDGSTTIKRYAPILAPSFKLEIIDDLGHHDALEFLQSHPAALVVCPSLQDNSPFAVIENLLLGTNLVTCRTGGIPELFANLSRLAEPRVADLSRLLRDGLNGTLPAVESAYSIKAARAAWDQFLDEAISFASTASSEGVPSRRTNGLQCYPGPLGLIHSSDGDDSTLRPAFCEQVAQLNEGEIRLLTPPTSRRSLHECHWLILGPGSRLDDGFEASARAAISADPDCVWTCFVEFTTAERCLHTPLGACLEASLAANVFGLGMAILPGHLLTMLSDQGRVHLANALVDATSFWAFLVHLALTGASLDVIPEKLVTITEGALVLENGPDSYSQQSSIISDMSPALPEWMRRLLPYTLELSPSQVVQDGWGGRSSPPIGTNPSVRGALRHHIRKLRDRYSKP